MGVYLPNWINWQSLFATLSFSSRTYLNSETVNSIIFRTFRAIFLLENHLPHLTFSDFGQSRGSTRWTDVRARAHARTRLRYTPK